MAKANKWRFQLKPSHVITLISFQQKVNDYQWKQLKTILFFSEDEKKVWSSLTERRFIAFKGRKNILAEKKVK